MNETRLRTISNRDIYPDKLREEIAGFNSAVEKLAAARLAVTALADELRNKAITGELIKPENLPAEIAKLKARCVAMDVEEIRLLKRKYAFTKPITEANRAERDRLAGLEKERREEIKKGLNAVGVEGKRWDALINGDPRVIDLAIQRENFSGSIRIITSDDEARLAVLQARVSAVVPAL